MRTLLVAAAAATVIAAGGTAGAQPIGAPGATSTHVDRFDALSRDAQRAFERGDAPKAADDLRDAAAIMLDLATHADDAALRDLLATASRLNELARQVMRAEIGSVSVIADGFDEATTVLDRVLHELSRPPGD
jgi:hypothetical protein